jgi:hypothetical protein
LKSSADTRNPQRRSFLARWHTLASSLGISFVILWILPRTLEEVNPDIMDNVAEEEVVAVDEGEDEEGVIATLLKMETTVVAATT